MKKAKRTSRKQLWLMFHESELKRQAKSFLNKNSSPTVTYYINGMPLEGIIGIQVGTGKIISKIVDKHKF